MGINMSVNIGVNMGFKMCANMGVKMCVNGSRTGHKHWYNMDVDLTLCSTQSFKLLI